MAEAQIRGGASRKLRVAFVNTHPIQYFVPLYAHINRSADIEAVPIFLSDHGLKPTMDPGFGHVVRWDIDLLVGTDPVFLPGADRRTIANGTHNMIAPQIWSAIRRGGYDAVVVHGPAIPANFIALAAARSIGIPVFIRGETHLGLRRSRRFEALRSVVVPPIYRRFDGFLAIGSANREFYRSIGIPDERIWMFPYTVDNQRMIAASALTAEQRTAMRRRIGVIGERPAVLYASKLQPRKHPDDLIRACQILAAEGLDFELVIAGSGEMEAHLRALAASAAKPPIHFPGFFNQSEMPKLFGACDIFVLPSENEPWGLIINEAMCARLPIVATKETGAVPDLVKDGHEGRLFDAGDIEGLANALRPMLSDDRLRWQMGEQSLATISAWNYDRCVTGLRQALRDSGASKRER